MQEDTPLVLFLPVTASLKQIEVSLKVLGIGIVLIRFTSFHIFSPFLFRPRNPLMERVLGWQVGSHHQSDLSALRRWITRAGSLQAL